MERISSKWKWIIFLVLMAAVIAAVFLLWESFLFSHYLGGYNQYGLPVQRSGPGYLFFLYSWPVWLFPMLILIAVGAGIFWIGSVKFTKQEETNLSYYQSQQEAIDRLKKENEKLVQKLDVVQSNPYLQEKYHQLEKDFIALRYEYEESLNFIEKLLDKLPKSKKTK